MFMYLFIAIGMFGFAGSFVLEKGNFVDFISVFHNILHVEILFLQTYYSEFILLSRQKLGFL